jgi:hypothetical protein
LTETASVFFETMSCVRAGCAVAIIGAVFLSCSLQSPQDWQLPIKLGDSRDFVRSKLGDRKPCVPESVSQTCDSFPNSGISVEYDGDQIDAITIGGGRAGPGGIPYESKIVQGISIRDELPSLKAKLGEPVVIESGPPPRYKWRRPPWMIEVVLGVERDGLQKGKVLWITITNAVE